MATLKYDKTGRLLFTKEMKKEYTILLPMMANIQFRIMKGVFDEYGYNTELLETDGPEIAQVGLKYVHNDTCYPALLVIGQFIHALQSGKYDLHKTALMITQTGGGCRASNYIHFARRKQLASLSLMPYGRRGKSGQHRASYFLTESYLRR
ncbi:MAG: 2-hydroxyacyl-CoA dehydratase [Clostridia bacterium]|nr:2-hydroxyacyl-CoA dehydratase [Clostridia bacterium]